MCDEMFSKYSELKWKENEYAWHKFPDEMPKENGQYFVCAKGKLHEKWYGCFSWFDGFFGSMMFDGTLAKVDKIYAWKKIEPYEC